MRKFLILLNKFVIKSKACVFVYPHPNCKIDKYDLANFTADNSLCIVNKFLRNYKGKKLKIYLTTFVKKRINFLKSYVSSFNNKSLKIRFIYNNGSLNSKLKFYYYSFKSSLLLCSTPSITFPFKTKKQHCICLNYSTPLKKGPQNKNENQYKCFDSYLETSHLTGKIHSDMYKLKPNSVINLGFPRNDYILRNEKAHELEKIIKKQFDCKSIFVYAPTYRDSEINDKAPFFTDKFYNFIKKNKILIMYKPHPLQKFELIGSNEYVYRYEASYQFSLYDWLALSDGLISDYSSVIHDYIVSDKPIIIFAPDRDKFENDRGFCFDNLNDIIPNSICESEEQLINSISSSIKKNSLTPKYYEVKSLFHTYSDNYTDRVYNYLLEILE